MHATAARRDAHQHIDAGANGDAQPVEDGMCQREGSDERLRWVPGDDQRSQRQLPLSISRSHNTAIFDGLVKARRLPA
jgi:hypothetical protein